MSEIIILGAGMVGVTAARELQARGHSVLLVDRADAGQETSFGNAGIIQAECAEPHSLPRDITTLYRMVAGKTNEFTCSAGGLLASVPALLQYYRSSHPERFREISAIYTKLTSQSTKDHAVWIEEAGAGSIIDRRGFNFVYHSQLAFDAAAKDAERIAETYGVQSRVVDGMQFAQEEPAITHAPTGVVHWTEAWSCSDPGALTQEYANLFVNRGGEMAKGNAATLRESGTGWAVTTAIGNIKASAVVVALGPWSPQLLKRFGYKIPMLLKRGYHAHFAAPVMPQLPFVDTTSGVAVAPMSSGLRVSTGVSIVRHNAPANPKQLVRGANGLSKMMQLGERIEEPLWVGTRPFIPDMLPIVGRSPRHESLWFNFGHGHQGFTLGPTTARVLGDAMFDVSSTKELQAALSPSRFT